jgi:hypothetical protein
MEKASDDTMRQFNMGKGVFIHIILILVDGKSIRRYFAAIQYAHIFFVVDGTSLF